MCNWARTGRRKSFLRQLCFAVVWAVLVLSSTAAASTPVSGSIYSDTTWDPAGSPYVLAGDLTVTGGVTLTVQAGVEVQTNSVNYELFVQGLVRGEGVAFTGNDTDIRVRQGGDMNLTNCSFQAGKVYYYSGSFGTINNCHGNWSLDIASSAVAVINGSNVDSISISAWPLIINSTIGYIVLSDGKAWIQDNTLTDSKPLRITNLDVRTNDISSNIYSYSDPEILISGTLEGSATLGFLDGIGKYRLAADSFVNAGATLTIDPGLEIQTFPVHYELFVDGKVNARAVNFRGGQMDIRVRDGGRLELADCSFEGGSVYYYSGGSGAVDNCSGTWRLDIAANAVSVINNCQISNVRISASPSILDSSMDYIEFSSGTPTVSGNTLSSAQPLRMNNPHVYLDGVSGNTYTHADPEILLYGQNLLQSRTLDTVDGLNRYNLSYDLFITSGVTLDIAPGIEFYSGAYCEIFIDGFLIAEGVAFTSSDTDIRVRWGGQMDLTTCTLDNASIYYRLASSGTMQGCRLDVLTIDSGATVTISNNDFSNGSLYATGEPAATINLADNFWGTTQAQQIEEKIIDHFDDPARPSVNFQPMRSFPLWQETAQPPDPGVLELSVPGELKTVDPNITIIDSNKPTVILVHGWNPDYPGLGVEPGTMPVTMAQMADSMLVKPWAVNHNILWWDWTGPARTKLPAGPAGKTPRGGNALAEALLANLGTSYNHKIHLIGMGLGAAVNRYAADRLHASGWDSANTRITLLDAVQPVQPFLVPDAVPDQGAWVDSYITAFGNLDDRVVNVVLQEGMPASGNIATLVKSHRYPIQWYRNSVEDPQSSIMGHRWSFETGAAGGWAAPGTCYAQTTAGNDDQMNLEEVSWQGAQTTIAGRIGLDIVQETLLTYDVMEGPIRLLGTVVLDMTSDTVGAKLIEASSSYMWMPLAIPAETDLLRFDYRFIDTSDGDYLTASIGNEQIFASQAAYVDNSSDSLSSWCIEIAEFAGQSVELLIAFNSDGIPGGQLEIGNLTFYHTELAPSCGDANHPYPIGDLDNDCHVDWTDFSIFAAHWLESGCAADHWCSGADLDSSGQVNWSDFGIFAAHWLECTAPQCQ